MALTVAELVARLSYVSEGEQAAINAAKRVQAEMGGVADAAKTAAQETAVLQQAQKALEASSESLSASVAKQRGVVADAVASWGGMGDAMKQIGQVLADNSSSFQTLNADIKTAQAEWVAATAAVNEQKAAIAGLRQEQEALRKARDDLDFRTQRAEYEALEQEIQQLEERTKQYRQELERLREVEGKAFERATTLQGVGEQLELLPEIRTEALDNIEKQTQGLNRELAKTEGTGKRAANGLRVTNGEVGRLLTGLATGRASLYSFNEFFGRMILGMKNALPVIGAVAAPIAILVGGFKIASSATVQFGQALASARPEIRGAFQDLEDLTNFDGSALLGFLEQATNRLRSFGAIDATGTAETIAELANIGQFRLPGPGDAGQVAQMLQRAVEGASFEPLRDLGFPVDELNAKLQKLAEDGMTKAARSAQVLTTAAQILNEDVFSGEAQARANAEMNTMAGVMTEIKTIWESIGQDQQLVDAATEFANALREAIPAIKTIAGWAAAVGTFLVQGATEFVNLLKDPPGWLRDQARAAVGAPEGQGILQTILPGGEQSTLGEGAFLGPLGLKLKGIDVESQKVKDSWKEWEDQYGKVEDAASTLEDQLGAVEDIMSEFDDTADQTAKSLTRMQKAMADAGSRQGAFGLIDSVKQLSQAFANMEQDASTSNSIAALQAYDRVLSQVIEKGPEQLELLRLQAERLFATGLINEDEFRAITRGFDAVEDVVKPIEQEAARIRGRLDENAGATQTFTGELNTANSAASAVGGTIGGWTGQINSATSAAINFAGVLGGISLTNPLGFTGFGPTASTGGSTFGTGNRRTGPDFARQGAGGRGLSAADRALLNSAPGSAPDLRGKDLRNAIENAGDIFGIKAAGAGGGGGGGGSAGASLEEIRQLFRNIGELIKIGTNNGVFFSPAGNAIPLGGPNEFLNTKGGSLIQTVNIRGIWDFADPAAKRQIIKELEEALAGLKSEVK